MAEPKFIKLENPNTFKDKEGNEHAYVSSNDVFKYTEKTLIKIIKGLFKKQDIIMAISIFGQENLERMINTNNLNNEEIKIHNNLDNGKIKIISGIKILGRYTDKEDELKDLFVVCYNGELYEISDAPKGYGKPLVEISKIVSEKIINDFKEGKLKDKYRTGELTADGAAFAPVAFIPKKIYQEKFNGLDYLEDWETVAEDIAAGSF